MSTYCYQEMHSFFVFYFSSRMVYGIQLWILLIFMKNPFPLVSAMTFFEFKLTKFMPLSCALNIFSLLELVYVSTVYVMDSR